MTNRTAVVADITWLNSRVQCLALLNIANTLVICSSSSSTLNLLFLYKIPLIGLSIFIYYWLLNTYSKVCSNVS